MAVTTKVDKYSPTKFRLWELLCSKFKQARQGRETVIARWAESRVIKRERRMIEIENQKMIEIGKIFYLIFLHILMAP